MHKLFGSFAAAVKAVDIITPMYCATNITRKAGFYSAVCSKVQQKMKRMKFSYEPPSEETVHYNSAIVDLLNGMDDEVQRPTHAPRARIKYVYACMCACASTTDFLFSLFEPQFCPGWTVCVSPPMKHGNAQLRSVMQGSSLCS